MTKEEKVFDYKYTACGLNNVIISDMPYVEDDEGNAIVQIPLINVLHANISLAIAMKESGIAPDELKFVRTELGFTQAELAEAVKKTHQAIGRWERGEHPIDPTAEVIVRLLVIEHLEEIGFIESIDENVIDKSIESLSKKCVPAANNNPINIHSKGNKGYSLVA